MSLALIVRGVSIFTNNQCGSAMITVVSELETAFLYKVGKGEHDESPTKHIQSKKNKQTNKKRKKRE